MTEPTPPIAFARDAGDVVSRWSSAPLEPTVVQALRQVCPDVVTERAGRAEASRDWWPLAMHWALAGQVGSLAGAVCRPVDAAEVAAVLRVCHERSVPVTAAGGRSGVCGASVPACGGVVLDLTAMAGVTAVDDDSLTVDVLPGTFGPDLEADLRAQGLTLGHWPQSMDISTVGGWLACRGAGQYSTRYGKIEDMVVGLDVVLADGTSLTTGGAPRSAAGPDLTQLFVGSEGTLGIITALGCGSTRSPRPSVEPPTASPRGTWGSTRAAGSCAAAPRRPCCGCTTRPSPSARTGPTATSPCCSCSTRPRPASSTR